MFARSALTFAPRVPRVHGVEIVPARVALDKWSEAAREQHKSINLQHVPGRILL